MQALPKRREENLTRKYSKRLKNLNEKYLVNIHKLSNRATLKQRSHSLSELSRIFIYFGSTNGIKKVPPYRIIGDT